MKNFLFNMGYFISIILFMIALRLIIDIPNIWTIPTLIVITILNWYIIHYSMEKHLPRHTPYMLIAAIITILLIIRVVYSNPSISYVIWGVVGIVLWLWNYYSAKKEYDLWKESQNTT